MLRESGGRALFDVGHPSYSWSFLSEQVELIAADLAGEEVDIRRNSSSFIEEGDS